MTLAGRAESISAKKKQGVLYGVGVGPGAADLLTLRAHRLISGAGVIAYPTLAGGQSFARSIVAEFIPKTAQEIVMDVPMTTDRRPAQSAYDAGASSISKALDAGQDVVCLCEGDPFFYGSFMYLHARLAGQYDVRVVPGVASMSACAAVAERPLVARNEVMTILPGPLPEEDLRAHLDKAETLVLMKVGRHLPKLRSLLDEMGLTQSAVYVERATIEEQAVLPLSDAPETAPYFSMILVTKGADPWL